MNRNELRNKMKEIIFSCIMSYPKATNKLYKDVSAFITHLCETYNNDYDYLNFVIEDVKDYLNNNSYILSKFIDMNIFQRKAYILVVIESRALELKTSYQSEQRKITEHSSYSSNMYNITITNQEDKLNRPDISRFIGGDN